MSSKKWDTRTLSDISFVTDFSANGSFAGLRENVEYKAEQDYAILVRLVDFSRKWNGDFVYIPKHSYDFLKKCQLDVADVIIANIGANSGTLFRVPKLDRPSALGPNALVIKTENFPNTSKDFLYYYFISPLGQNQIQSIITGSAQPKFSKTDLRNLKIPFPPLSTQRRVADILSALDDKIELNRQTNATLEALAQAIFKEWFFDFNFPGASGEMVESELGLIPKGWRVDEIGNVVEALGGGTPSTKEVAYWDNGIHNFVTPKDLSNLSSPILLETERKVTDVGLSKISSGLLPANTLLMSSRAPVGYLAISQIPICINQGFIAMKPIGNISNIFLLNWSIQNMEEIRMRASGTTFPEISKKNFRPIPIIVPSDDVLRAFDTLVTPLYEKITASLIESQTLITIRDTLIPKLMGGEIEV